ncbi:TonB system transport protein ExbD [Helicobacter magdeburgensis]|uniref:Biopolymer transport protein ExbD n=3 Tax=Helicobacter TaxID=209 RepID=A0A4U8SYF0_9HELI|nr:MULTISPECIES: TonB system transport protein ExbD [Helicobacter]TLD92050.1 TonB system transport protein ExbD [Helicobacter magdeburgensis]STP09126.1 biopolymer transport protein [Helicobacter cinaedi]STP10603.1 biopolymer transport protein [Helicobacter cinaedi]BAM11799.1 biopolymer transport protein [Helicobacter cinaedi PAGU611]BBB19373.1 biopolymer transport protein ExbD/TolR [Helicobacter cinaedi]
MRIPKKDGLNIVPFIDVMLVLLAIVLSVSTFIAQGQIKVELPYASQNEQKQDEKPVIIAIDDKNVIYFDDKQIEIESLKEQIAKIDNKTLIQLKSDKDSKFETFIQIVDILKEKGHENFGISTKSK